jgi:hypothetical protein
MIRINCFLKTFLIISCFFILSTSFSGMATAGGDRFKKLKDGTIQDQKTGLIWAAKDNSGDINWSTAVEYCKNYSGGGHNDWRMPAASELASLYGNTVKVKGKDYSQTIDIITTSIKISAPWVWTNRRTPDNKAVAFGFNYGVNRRLHRGTGGNRRAIAVRSAK